MDKDKQEIERLKREIKELTRRVQILEANKLIVQVVGKFGEDGKTYIPSVEI